MIESVARGIVHRLSDAGFVAYYAGGYVRDKLLGQESPDIDIATSATPEQVMKLFEKTIPVGLAYGSVLVVEDGHSFEVTTFRTEGGYTDGRHPGHIAYATAEEDAKRRSITINGMFYDPLEDKILDYVGGKKDLKDKIVRAIGDPGERFEEDRLRMIRAIRFATRFGFTIEPKTRQAIIDHAHTLLPATAVERIWQEFCKMAGHPQMGAFLVELHACGLLQQIFPELGGVEIEPLVAPFIHYPPETPTIAYIMALFPEPSEKIARRLKVSGEDLRLISLLTQLKECSDPVSWVHFYAEDLAPLCLQIVATGSQSYLAQHAEAQKRLAPHIERRRNRRPLVTSQHLRQLGVEAGPRMGELLRRAEALAIVHDLSDPQAVLELLLPVL